jgi:hypothetical protein
MVVAKRVYQRVAKVAPHRNTRSGLAPPTLPQLRPRRLHWTLVTGDPDVV